MTILLCRSTLVLEKMLGAGLVWYDPQAGEEKLHWVPSIFKSKLNL